MRSTLLPASRPARRRSGASSATRGTAAIAFGATLVAGSGGVVLSLLASTNAGAAPSDLIVSNLLDNSSPGSLRHAIEYSNANGGGAITVQSGLTGTINLSADLPLISEAISITGPGHASLTVDGGDTFKMFESWESSVAISGLSLTNSGGGQATIVMGHRQQTPLYMNVNAPVALSDVVISGNGSGGGIRSNNLPAGRYVSSSLTNSVITGNSGFGVGTTEANWTITGSTISYNGQGGLFSSYGQTATLSDSTFSHNGDSGIEFFDTHGVSIDNVESSYNTSTYGGGLRMRRPITASVTDSTFTNNIATTYGGGGISGYGATFDFTRVTVSGNASNYGGGMRFGNASIVNITDSVISDNSVTGDGGGIKVNNGSVSQSNNKVTLTNTSVTGNTANAGGGGISMQFARLYTDNAEISDNDGNHASGTAKGGGVLLVRSQAEFVSSILDGNSAYAGGGVRVSSSTVNVLYSAITSNVATQGGAFSITSVPEPLQNPSRSTVSIDHSLLANNDGTIGGALWADISDTTVDNSTITGNAATSYSVARLLGDSSLTIEESTIAQNTDSAVSPTEAVSGPDATSSFTSSILWGNTRNNTNEIGNTTSVSGTTFTDSIVDHHGTIVDGGGNLASDPLLAPLADNGGATETMALTYGSPALNAGSSSSRSSFDQRGAGFTRKIGSFLDIGAYEAQTPPTPPTTSTSTTSTSTTSTTSTSTTTPGSTTTTAVPDNGGGADPADGGSGGPLLPVTGSDALTLMFGGSAVLVGGSLLALAARRNRRLL
jgi:hypothetical protein